MGRGAILYTGVWCNGSTGQFECSRVGSNPTIPTIPFNTDDF